MATAAATSELPLRASGSARAEAARIWRYRFSAELRAAQRFDTLATDLRALGASRAVAQMASRAASDELRHADLCLSLVRHFGADVRDEPPVESDASERGRAGSVLHEVVALACVTETLSTALLGELVDRARDPLARRVMHSILSDEVAHSRIGWAVLAEGHAQGARASIAEHLPQMLSRALGDESASRRRESDAVAAELAGLGSLPWPDKQRIVTQVLELVVFPGLDRFGIDTTLGRAWFAQRRQLWRKRQACVREVLRAV